MEQLGPGAPGYDHFIKSSADGGMWITAGPEFDNRVYRMKEGIITEVSGLKRVSDFNTVDIHELDGLVLLSGISGIVGYNSSQDNNRHNAFPVSIRQVLTQTSLLFGGNGGSQESEEVPVLSFGDNDLRFVFALPAFDNPKRNEYQNYLDGYDQEWSSWTTETQRDFTNLPEGEYTFRVRGRNTYGQVSDEGRFTFTILPPWYRSWWAYLLSIVTGFIALRMVVRWRSSRLQREKAALEVLVKERTRQLEEQAVELKEMDQMKSRLFANISHEFRTPLTLIKGPIAEWLNTSGATLRRSDAQMIDRNADRLLRLVNQLLDVSKLDAGNLELEPKKGNVNLFLRSLSSAFCSHAEQRKITYQIDIPQDEQYTGFDHDKLEKIVYNLLSNAFKFTPDQGQVAIRATCNEGQLTLTVTDSGRGIAAEALPKIFDRFFQADNSETREQEGTGIGLALTKELTHLMGGTIAVHSVVGKGSTFTVTIPMQSADSEPVVWEPARTQNAGAGTAEIRDPEIDQSKEAPVVLLVEDNADMRRFIKDQLTEKYRILEGNYGDQGLEIACQEIPDLIITDLMMPGMDGVELCARLKADERTSHIPVVMLTARAGQEQKIEGLETGADDYLTKPFDKVELLVRINNLIVQRHRLRERFSRQMILEPGNNVVDSIEEKFLRKVMQKLEENLSDSAFAAPQLQEMLAMSKTQLYRKMKALTDQSPGEFIRNYRLKRAAQILAGRGENVTQVAYSVGFNNLSYFAKCFKELHGVSPSEYNKGGR